GPSRFLRSITNSERRKKFQETRTEAKMKRNAFFFLLFLLGCWMSADALPMIPGMDVIASTLNPLLFDLLGTDPSGSSAYFHAFTPTFSQNKTAYGLNGQLYAIPDQANVVMEPGGSCTAASLFEYNSYNFSQSFSSSFSGSAVYKLFSGSLSWSTLT